MRAFQTDTFLPSTLAVEWRVSARARRLGVTVRPGGQVALTVPARVSSAAVERFLRHHRDWILRAAERMASLPPRPSRTEAHRNFLRYREQARRTAYSLIARYAPFYGVQVRSVSIRDQRSRWGSCSRKGGLSFNYRIALLPELLAVYVVVHELCHLVEFNHSERFWAQVARTVPNHRAARKALRASYPAYA